MNTVFTDRRSPEFNFITCSLKVLLSEHDCCEIRNIYENGRNAFNWEKLIEEADVLDVLPFIYRAVLHSGIKESLPPELFSKLEKE